MQLKNTKTLEIRSFITRDNGNYYFHGLSTDVDYELRADYNGDFQSDQDAKLVRQPQGCRRAPEARGQEVATSVERDRDFQQGQTVRFQRKREAVSG